MFPVTTHMPMSPSRLYMFFECPGAFSMSRKYQSNIQSGAAAEGEYLHSKIEHFIRSAQAITDNWVELNSLFRQGFSVDKDYLENQALSFEQASALNDALEYLANVHVNATTPIELEKQLKLYRLDPVLYECGGTNDVSFTTVEADPNDPSITRIVRHVLDWKFGRSEPIWAANNDQLLAYAWGQIIEDPQDYDIVRVHIVMPRLEHYDSADYTKSELRAWLHGRAIPGAQRCYDEIPTFNAGKHCRWCPGKMQCRHRQNFHQQTAAQVFAAAMELPDVSVAELAEWFPKLQALKTYISELEKFAQSQLLTGQEFPGYKMVSGRSSRKWKDEALAEAFLLNNLDIEEVYDTKLISVAAAEKKAKRFKKNQEFLDLYEKAEGRPTMVPESDKRPALDLRTAADIFADYADNSDNEDE